MIHLPLQSRSRRWKCQSARRARPCARWRHPLGGEEHAWRLNLAGPCPLQFLKFFTGVHTGSKHPGSLHNTCRRVRRDSTTCSRGSDRRPARNRGRRPSARPTRQRVMRAANRDQRPRSTTPAPDGAETDDETRRSPPVRRPDSAFQTWLASVESKRGERIPAIAARSDASDSRVTSCRPD
jgi:hypothetical protein